MSTVGELNVKVTADTSALKNKIERDAQASGSGFGKKFGLGLAKVGGLAAAAGGAALAAGGAIAAFGVQAASANETAAVSFNVLLGSAEKAKGFLADLNDFAAKTPFDLPGIKKAASQLLSVGVESEKVIPLMGAIGDATAAMGTGADGVNRATKAIQKMGVTNKVTMESINMLAEAGVPIIDALATKMGKTPAEVADMVSKGAIEVNDVLTAIETRQGEGFKRVSGMMDEQSKTFAGQISTLKDEMEQSLANAAAPLLDSLKDVLPEITEALKGLVEGFQPVIEQIGPLIESLIPLIKPLADILGALGAAVGEILVTAFQTLLPSITPVLDILSDLANRIGPLLGPIIGKLAQVLARLLDAVLPLLAPLIDLVFTILEAAAPIIDIAADVLLILIDALAPLLQIVGTLLKPLGELINVLFAAIMPILQPLLPVITALATVFADVLGRAIGLIITAVGYMIQAWAKLAPFMLRNVIQPILSNFLKFAANLVGAAESAFGWVPGLGDKLSDAKNAVDKFASDTEKGIGNLADTIETEGAKIGKGLVDQGVATMTNPTESARLTGAAKGLGNDMASGMAIGIRNGQIPVAAASSALAQGAVTAAKTTLRSQSPSKVFIEIGGDVVEGFEIGLGKMDGVPDKMRNHLQKVVDASNERLNQLVSDTRDKLDEAVQIYKDFRAEVMGAITGNVNFVDALGQTREQEAAVIAAQEALNEAKAKAAQDGASDNDKSAVSAAETELAKAQAAVKSYEANLETMLQDSEFFGTMFSQASDAMIAQFGAGSPIWTMMREQMLTASPEEGAALAKYLTENGLTPEMEQRLLGWNAWAGQVATDQAEKNHRQGIDMAENAMLGIEDAVEREEKRIKRIGKEIGNGIVIGFKSKKGSFKSAVDDYIATAMSALGINSPSKVFIGIGENVGEGFGIGVKDSMPEWENVAPKGLLGPSSRMYAPSLTSTNTMEAPNVRVFIGDKELTDIVRTEVGQNNDDLARSLVLGRR